MEWPDAAQSCGAGAVLASIFKPLRVPLRNTHLPNSWNFGDPEEELACLSPPSSSTANAAESQRFTGMGVSQNELFIGMLRIRRRGVGL